MKTKKRIVIAAVAGIGIAGLLLALGTVLQSNADFSDDYVARQMAQQRISFKPVEQLTDAEKQSACVVANAGRELRSGAQAECFANEYIALHLGQIGQGKTYAELGAEEFALQAQIDDATDRGSSRLPALQADMTQLRMTRDLLFKGETLRGLLLTSYGFSTLGDKAAQAATVSFVVAGALAALSLLGLGLTFAAGRSRTVGMVPHGASA